MTSEKTPEDHKARYERATKLRELTLIILRTLPPEVRRRLEVAACRVIQSRAEQADEVLAFMLASGAIKAKDTLGDES